MGSEMCIRDRPGTWIDEKITMPQAGYIMMHIWGSGFMGGTDYRCKINQNAAIEATYDPPSDSIKCWSDLWIDGTNYVEVTLNGREYTSDGHHTEINQFWFDERYNSYEHTNSGRGGAPMRPPAGACWLRGGVWRGLGPPTHTPTHAPIPKFWMGIDGHPKFRGWI